MTKRATRAQLLMPSFLVAAGLVGCSGRSVGENPGDGGAGGGGNTGGSGSTSGSSGGSVSQGGRKGDVTCPEHYTSEPRACAVEKMTCLYTDGECTSELYCEAGVWVDYSPSCNPPELVDCPEELPTVGSRCDDDPFVEYPDECAYPVVGCGQVVATCEVLPGTWKLQGSCAGGEGGAPSGAGAAGESAGGAGAGGQGGAGG
jgi:hypothetical protein